MGIEQKPIEKIDFTGEENKRKKLYIIIGGVLGVLVLVGAGIAFATWGQEEPPPVVVEEEVAEEEPEEEPVPEDTRVASFLNGELVEPEIAERRPLLVVVENHVASRPPHGLIEADVVYELLVEGGITRFLAIYQQNEPERVGPERSARAYMLDWVKEYNAVFAHIGQDPYVLTLFRPYGVDSLSSFAAVWDPPSSGRSVEHRAYTSVPRLREAIVEKGWAEFEPVESWAFNEFESVLDERPASQTIRVNYGSNRFLSQWEYNREANHYVHSYGGESHIDAINDQPIWAKNVIAMEVQTWRRQGDTAGRLDMKTDGEGVATIFRDGQVIEATWQKDSREGRTVFVDESGEPVALNPGKIWVNVVPAFEDRVSHETTPQPQEPAAEAETQPDETLQ